MIDALFATTFIILQQAGALSADTETEKENRLDDKTLIAQMNEQQYEYLQPKTAQERIHLKFWHPQGKHDDQLMALALACRAASRAAPPGRGAIMGG